MCFSDTSLVSTVFKSNACDMFYIIAIVGMQFGACIAYVAVINGNLNTVCFNANIVCCLLFVFILFGLVFRFGVLKNGLAVLFAS